MEDEYSQYFRTMGIPSRMLIEDGPDWINHAIPGFGRDVIGALQIGGKNFHQLDLLKVEARGGNLFLQLFVVRANVGDNSYQFKAQWSVLKPFSLKRPIEFSWKGGAIVETMKMDSHMNDILTSHQKLLTFDAHKNIPSVTILLPSAKEPQYLDQEYLEAIDMIAGHILKFVPSGP
jgi:hypothetical protein